MKTTELKELSADELAKKIATAKAELADLKLKHASKVEIEKPVRMRQMRRDIARMMTVQNMAAKKAAPATAKAAPAQAEAKK